MGETGVGACPRCGYPRTAEDEFCARCGADLPAVTVEVPQAAVPSSEMPQTWPTHTAGEQPQTWPPPAPVASRPPRRGSLIALLVALALVLAVGLPVALYVILRSDEAPEPTSRARPVSSATPSPSPVTAAGIDAPLLVDGLELQLTSADRQDRWVADLDGSVYRPNTQHDELLIVAGTVTGSVDVLQTWEVSITDSGGRSDDPGVTSTTSTEGESGGEVEWVFVVARNARSFSLNLPGGETIDLTPLL
jgi:hypothetical protein